jgi:phosphoribosylaminoimidazole (AIR) synthetase
MAYNATSFYLDISTCNTNKNPNLFFQYKFFFEFQSGFSQDEMFEYFNCGVDYLLLIDHTKTTTEDILRQLTETHTSSFFLGTFISISKLFLTHRNNSIFS